MENGDTWSRSVGMKEMALQVAATLTRLQNTVYLTGVFSSMPWNKLLSLKEQLKRWHGSFSFNYWKSTCFFLTGLTAAGEGRVALPHGTLPASHTNFQSELLASLAPGLTAETRCCSLRSQHLQRHRKQTNNWTWVFFLLLLKWNQFHFLAKR